jgi:hypothetical protein
MYRKHSFLWLFKRNPMHKELGDECGNWCPCLVVCTGIMISVRWNKGEFHLTLNVRQLSRIWSPRSGNYEGCQLWGCNALYFGRTYCLHLQDRRISQARKYKVTGGKQSALMEADYSSETSVWTYIGLHGVIFQKIIRFSIRNPKILWSACCRQYGVCLQQLLGNHATVKFDAANNMADARAAAAR